MVDVLLGLAGLAVALWFLRDFKRRKPGASAFLVSRIVGPAAVLLGLFLCATGRLPAGLPLLLFGLGLTGWLADVLPRTGRPRRAGLRMRSGLLEMEMDGLGRPVRGRVIAGSLAGRALESLHPAEWTRLLREAGADPRGRLLLEAYLDGRAPGWREHFQQDTAAGTRESRASGAMTKEEAHQILGVHPGAAADEIVRAHRSLIKKLHPDHGGSTYLAARVNEAKDVLLGGHR